MSNLKVIHPRPLKAVNRMKLNGPIYLDLGIIYF